MRAPGSFTGAEASGWSPARRSLDSPARRWDLRRWRLLRIAGAVLAVVILAALGWREAPLVRGVFQTRLEGTAFLGTATCSNWRDYTQSRRLDVVTALGLAATGPDPESSGATLETGAAYSLFQRACSTRASRSSLLYEVYNRAASFQPAAVGPIVREGGFGTAAHR